MGPGDVRERDMRDNKRLGRLYGKDLSDEARLKVEYIVRYINQCF